MLSFCILILGFHFSKNKFTPKKLKLNQSNNLNIPSRIIKEHFKIDTTTLETDFFFKEASILAADYDGDGIADNLDKDKDNDGIPNEDECSGVTYGAELIVNGDFENGYAHWTSDFNRGINNRFGTDGNCGAQGWVALSPCASQNGGCGTYYEYNGSNPTGSSLITSNLGSGANVITTSTCNSTLGSCWAQSLPDHTTGSGLSLYVDPNDIVGESYWIQTITIQANTFYEFTAWIMVIEEDPNLVFKINNTNLTNVFNLDRQTGGSDGTDVWQPVLTTWFSGSNSGNVVIELVNVTTGCGGNDIRLDDVSFRKVNNLCDCDGDGIANIYDLDSDNDGISDLDEAGHSAADSNNDGVIDGSSSLFGSSGLFNSLETSSNSGIANYTIKDSESTPDGTYDFCEIDADGDGCLDTQEASISDSDKDGVAGNGTPTITTKGLVSGLSYSNPSNTGWQNPATQAAACVEICGNNIDDNGDGIVDCPDVIGVIFEDVNYGGGLGRGYSAANTSAVASGWSNNGIRLPNVRVELYNSVGAFVTSTTTSSIGQYVFSEVAAGDYSIRVVNGTITSLRPTNATYKTTIPVQTFRQTTAVAYYNEVGGANPALADAGSNTSSASLASLTTASTTAQSVTSITVGTTNVGNNHFGYNFSTITNTNDAGQGSLRQFILNSNELGNTNLDQEDSPSGGVSFPKAAGWETTIFMIPGTSTHTITATSNIDLIRDVKTHISGYTQAGSAQGTISARTLKIKLVGATTSVSGLSIYEDDGQISGLVLHSFNKAIRSYKTGTTGSFVWGNYVGIEEDGVTPVANSSDGITFEAISNSFIGMNDDNVNDANEGNLVVESFGGVNLKGSSNALSRRKLYRNR